MAEKKHIHPAAVALKYQQSSDVAPKVTAKGRGILAQKILQIAELNKIPVHKNELLLEALMSIELEKPIPPVAFKTVAEIYAFLMKLDREYAKNVN